MKFEKRGDVSQETPNSAPEAAEKTGSSHSKKPVIIYIMIMFIVAFLLMALSFIMHQRSNTEVLGQLQDSVNAMQTVQETQEKIISLQDQLSKSEDQVDKLTEDMENLQEDLDTTAKVNEALMSLYALQQQYANQDYESCKAIITRMEEETLVEALPQDSMHGATAPYERYAELKDAVQSK